MSGYLKASIWILAAFSFVLVVIYFRLPGGAEIPGDAEGFDKVEVDSSEKEVVLKETGGI